MSRRKLNPFVKDLLIWCLWFVIGVIVFGGIAIWLADLSNNKYN